MQTLTLESEPITTLLQESTYRELVLRQRVNEAAQAVMVAYANGSDLDQLGANNNVSRLVAIPANNDAIPPVVAVMESDADFRLRIPQAFEALSVAGPTGAYEAHTRSAAAQARLEIYINTQRRLISPAVSMGYQKAWAVHLKAISAARLAKALPSATTIPRTIPTSPIAAALILTPRAWCAPPPKPVHATSHFAIF
ncbi:baseplate assembly protein [Yersinia pekkanenii]|uniref:Baseplate assembly protein n=1 Tax=Yersinia pekkanenii TaxID=1288385 RepID=A0A0T9QWQ1_9GAMM|nr:baseplate assembly protein [Yersinia pekkanenii]CRY66176.1 baseplate assembly protein [Yersinia pekkanenii]